MKPLTLIDKVFLLKKTRLFGNLDLDLLLTIADKMGMVSFKAGSKIFHLNQEANRMYLIVEGSITIQDSQHHSIGHLSKFDFFGDEAIFNEKPRAYEAISHTDTLLLTLSRSHLLTIITECPSVAIGLLEVYAANIGFRERKS
jgi:CRP/FNR family transcriptional regulator, cyclic AMP receptor protein